jgi:manganese/zinc/iron transport system permease protein
MTTFFQIDFPAALTALFATLVCALAGNFLVLRREALLGDALSHAVLPGIVVGFLLSGTRAALPMILGAAGAAVLAAVLVHFVRRYGRVEPGAALGVVFTVMFALGVVMLEQGAAHRVDLDPDCVLYGQLETVIWLAATGPGSLIDPGALVQLPRELVTLAVTFTILAALTAWFWKEIQISTFDPELATSLGIPANIFRFGVTLAAAVATVVSFEAVGSILVVAMLVCPAAAARLFANRYGSQLAVTLAIAAFTAIAGYVAASFGPAMLGAPIALNAAGMIAALAGAVLAVAALFTRHGGPWRGQNVPTGLSEPTEGKDVSASAPG